MIKTLLWKCCKQSKIDNTVFAHMEIVLHVWAPYFVHVELNYLSIVNSQQAKVYSSLGMLQLFSYLLRLPCYLHSLPLYINVMISNFASTQPGLLYVVPSYCNTNIILVYVA
jgi:hypothetical protein